MSTIRVGACFPLPNGTIAVAQRRVAVNPDGTERWMLAVPGGGDLALIERDFDPRADHPDVLPPRTFAVGDIVSIGGGLHGSVASVEDGDPPMYEVRIPGQVIDGERSPDRVYRAPGHRLNVR